MTSKRVNSHSKSLNSIPPPSQAPNSKSGSSPPSPRKSRSSSSSSLTARDYAAQKMLSNIDDILVTTSTISGSATAERPALSLFRTCLELKKLIQDCPETIERVFLSKLQPNISTLYKIHKATDDMAVLQLVCWLYSRTVDAASTNELTHLIKTGLINAIFDTFHHLNDPKFTSSEAEAVRFSLCNLLLQFDKHDKKIALVARLTGSIPSLCDYIKECYGKEQHDEVQVGLKLLKIFCSCERNSEMIWKSSIQSVLIKTMHEIFTRNDDKYLTVLSLVFSISKKVSTAESVSSTLSMENVAKFVRDSSDIQARKYTAKIIRNCVTTRTGREKFMNSNAPTIMFKLAEHLSQSQSSSTHNATLNLVIYEILHECLEQIPIPYINETTNDKRPTFPLPKSTIQDQLDTFVDMAQFFPELGKSCQDDFQSQSGPKSIRDITAESPIGKPLLTNMPREPNAPKSSGFLKHVLMRDLSRTMESKNNAYSVIYDVYDNAICVKEPETLVFESRFESGNLRMAVKISETEYDLLVDSDINTDIGKHNQWFYFSVANMKPGLKYTFNVINMTKLNGSFNQGMQPVMFSKKSYQAGEKGWHRIGTDIYYYQNHYLRSQLDSETPFNYATLTFSVTFDKDDDTCWFAYHFPYTYSYLQLFLQERCKNPAIVRRQNLCTTLAGNNCDMLTITNFYAPQTEINSRQYVLLSARVHPGETNSSWIMQGLLESLLDDSDESRILRDKFIFKVVPMLNPDGVIHGSHRCSLSGEDLNRQWQKTSASLFPTIYWTKQLWKYVVLGLRKKPLLVCDFHGHSRRKNVFFFACDKEAPSSILETLQKVSAEGAVLETFQNVPIGAEILDQKPYVYGLEKIFPKLISEINSEYNGYSFNSGKFATEPSKESTCRIVLWRELGITSSFTCESSYCGSDCGPLSVPLNHYTSYHDMILFVSAVKVFSNTMEKIDALNSVDAFNAFLESSECLKSVLGFRDEQGTVVSPTTSESSVKPKAKGKKKKVLKKSSSSVSVLKADVADLTIRGSSIALTEPDSVNEGSELENQEEMQE